MPSKPSLGLYFTDRFIEISGIGADGRKLERYNHLILTEGLVVNGEIKNVTAFTAVLKKLLTSTKPNPVLPNEDVVVGISENNVFLREFTVPNLPGKDINDAIDYQVRLLLPVLPTGVVTDWQIIGRDSNGQIEILLAAVQKWMIESYVNVCRSVGLQVVALEPAVSANIRVINPQQVLDKNQLLVYLGDNLGSFSLVTGGNPRFSELLPKEEIENDGGMTKTVNTYISFANSKHANRPVQEVLVSGFSDEVENVVAELNKSGINAIKAVSRLSGEELVNQAMLHTAHGLSLKTLENPPALNLLPVEFRLNVVRDRIIRSWKNVINVLIALSLLVILGLGILNKTVSDNGVRLTARKDQYERAVDQNLIKQANGVNGLTDRLISLREITGGEENILDTMSALVTDGISLSSLQFTRNPGSKKLLDLKNSWIITGSANSRPLILSFYNNLISLPEFADGKLYFGSLEKDIGLSFRIASQPIK